MQLYLLIMLPIIGLATWQAVEVVRHSELFAEARAAASNDDPWFLPADWDELGINGFINALVLCPWCLSVWVALWFTLLSFTSLGALVITALAASRLANVCNDLSYPACRTPKQSDDDDDEEDGSE